MPPPWSPGSIYVWERARNQVDKLLECREYRAMQESLLSALDLLLPTCTELDVLFAKEPQARERVPTAAGRLAAPYEFEWSDDELVQATFEVYDTENPLGAVCERIYQAFLRHPAAQKTRQLTLGNVACKEFRDSQLLGDGIRLLARSGLPPQLVRLDLERSGPVTNAGDLGYYAVTRLTPLLNNLAEIRELNISGCESLGKFDLPNLRAFRLHSDVAVKNLKELARANLPTLERLELSCDLYAPVEQRFKAMRSLLRSSSMPQLRHLVIEELDLDEDARMELDDEAEAEPDSWVDMIANSKLLKQLESLELSFRDDARELPTLITRAESFRHLECLEFWGGGNRVKLVHPTAETLRTALNS